MLLIRIGIGGLRDAYVATRCRENKVIVFGRIAMSAVLYCRQSLTVHSILVVAPA